MRESTLTYIWYPSSVIGYACGTLVTGVIAAPGVIIDEVVRLLSCYTLQKNYALTSSCYDQPRWLPEGRSGAPKTNHMITKKCGFFAKYPFGVIAEKVGAVVNELVSSVLAILMGIAALGIATGVAGVMLSATVFIGACLFLTTLVRMCVVGPEQATSEVKAFLTK